MNYILSLYMICIGTLVQSQTIKDERLEVVASFGKSQPIGVSVSSDNRVFVSFPMREPYLGGLAEIVNGERRSFPDNLWNKKDGKETERFLNVQDIYVDTDDQLWVLDSKPAPSNSVLGDSGEGQIGKFKLLHIDLKTDKVVKIYDFEDLDKNKSALNDVRVDTEKGLAYLSDPGQAGIVVLNLKSGKSQLLLAGSEFTTANPLIILSYEGHEMRDKFGNPFRSHVNGVALTKDNAYFYFKPINKLNLYRIKTVYLSDVNLNEEELKNEVEDLGPTSITHGLVADEGGNIYLTSSLDYSIKRYTPDGRIETIVQDSRLIWPDSLGIGSDGYLYFSCAQVNRLPQWNGGENKVTYPYEVYRVKIL